MLGHSQGQSGRLSLDLFQNATLKCTLLLSLERSTNISCKLVYYNMAERTDIWVQHIRNPRRFKSPQHLTTPYSLMHSRTLLWRQNGYHIHSWSMNRGFMLSSGAALSTMKLLRSMELSPWPYTHIRQVIHQQLDVSCIDIQMICATIFLTAQWHHQIQLLSQLLPCPERGHDPQHLLVMIWPLLQPLHP